MGLDYTIQFWRGKENIVVDALSRREGKGDCQAITTMVPNWVKELVRSYEQTKWLKDLVAQLSMQPSGTFGYTLLNGLEQFKGRLVMGDDKPLKERILKALHC